jgi:murein tripeptide amidase MpaA
LDIETDATTRDESEGRKALRPSALKMLRAPHRSTARGGRRRPSPRLSLAATGRAMIAALLLALLPHLASAEEVRLVRVPIAKQADLVRLLSRHFDVVYVEPGRYAEIVASPGEIEELAAEGYQVIAQVRDLASYYAERAMADFGGYKTFSEIVGYLNGIHTDHPSITTAPFSIGGSIEGRDLWGIKVSDNPGVDEDEPEVLYTGLHHAREPISAELLLYTLDYLTDNYGIDPSVADIVDGRELYFLPVVNPDGYVYNETTDPDGGGPWRKNRRDNGGSYGVDLNRNYGYEWGYDNIGSSPYPSSVTYRGTGPFSEPEIQALRDFIESRSFSIALNYHSYGNLFLYPWGYDKLYTPDQLYFAAIADSAVKFNGYAPGPGWGLYVTNGGSDDWGYGEQSTKDPIFAFTPEVGSNSQGFWPLPSDIAALCEENLPVNLFVAQIADNPRKVGVPAPPTVSALSPVYTSPFDVELSHADVYNPAVVFELVELAGKSRVVDDLESGADLWSLTGFSPSSARTHSGSTSLYSGTGDNMESTAGAIERLEVGPADTLSVWCWYDIEPNYDYAYIEVSADGGVTYQSLAGNITTDYDPYGVNRGHGITGSSGGWVLGTFPLSAFAGTQVEVRILYATDESLGGEGIYCDDVGPIDSFAASEVLSSAIAGQSYQVYGRSPGHYYYKARAKDAEGQWGYWSDRATVQVEETVAPALSTLAALVCCAAAALAAVYFLRRRESGDKSRA